MTATEHIVSPADLAAEPVEIVKVTLNDKGGVMFIGSLDADAFADWNDAKNADEASRRTASANLIVRSLVKSETDATRIGTADMVPLFRKARMARTERLLKAILKLNGINQKDEDAVKNG